MIRHMLRLNRRDELMSGLLYNNTLSMVTHDFDN